MPELDEINPAQIKDMQPKAAEPVAGASEKIRDPGPLTMVNAKPGKALLPVLPSVFQAVDPATSAYEIPGRGVIVAVRAAGVCFVPGASLRQRPNGAADVV